MLAPTLLLLLLAAAATTAAPPPPPGKSCAGERLHNGICLPKAWPPRATWPASTAGLIPPPQPPYLTAPPAVRDISTGRSLFIDDFLVDAEASHGVSRTFFAAQYAEANPVITFDQPWEKLGNTYARPFSGGVAWDEPSRRYRLWYGCGDATFDDSNLALCLATSADGRAWDKENQTVVDGTNIVVPTPLRSNNVFAHPQSTDRSRRFVLGDTNGPHAPGESYWLWGSPDGVHWTALRNETGKTSDRGTFWHDPFRRRWVFSIKGYLSGPAKVYGRHRMYWETPDDDPFGAGVHWPSEGDGSPVLWAAADTLDQPGVCPGNCQHPEVKS